jgi:hypothetical protein
LVRNHFGDYAPRFIDRRKVGFICHCNRDQIRNVLTLLPIDELKDIQVKGPFPSRDPLSPLQYPLHVRAGTYRSYPGSTLFRELIMCVQQPSKIVVPIVGTTFFRLVLNTARRFAYPFAPVLSRGLASPCRRSPL